MSENEDIARQVRLLRLKRGVSQVELGSAIGAPQSSIARFEAGQHCGLHLLYRITKALKAEVDIRIIPLEVYTTNETSGRIN